MVFGQYPRQLSPTKKRRFVRLLICKQPNHFLELPDWRLFDLRERDIVNFQGFTADHVAGIKESMNH
jgi:hypothetical protein